MKISIVLPLAAASVLAQAPPPKPAAAAPKPAAAPKAASAAKPAAAKAAAPKPVAAAKAAAAPKTAPAPAVAAGPAVLVVGEERLTKEQFEAILDALPDQVKGQFASPDGKRQFARQLAEMKSLSQEARRRGLEQNPKVMAQLALQRDQLLAGTVAREISQKAAADNAAVEKYFNEHKGEYEKVNGRHILIRFQGSRVPLREGQKELTDAEALAKAQDVRKRIVGGEDFAELAKKESDDTGSGAAGGALGEFGRGRMVPPFEQAAFSLPLNEVSEPVRSQFGYHIIQIQSKTSQTIEEARGEVAQKMQRAAIEAVSKQSAVTLDESYFGKQ